MIRVFVDSSAWFAFINKKDAEHASVRSAMKNFEGRMVTSNFIFDELLTLCNYRLGHKTATAVGNFLLTSNSIDLVRMTPDDEKAAWEIFKKRHDKNYSFTDCTSFALMQRLKIESCIALDDDFAQEGFKVLPVVEL
ncbi:MAG: type II toxin-antitoxin system VapC family toxin [Planctomycetota bacterium]